MKRLLALLLLSVALCNAATNPVVIFNTDRFTGVALTNVTVIYRPLGIGSQNGRIVPLVPVTNVTDSTGSFTLTNVFKTSYSVLIQAGPQSTQFTNCFDTADGTVNAADFICTSNTALGALSLSRSASDARYPSVAGTNIIFYTNAQGRIVVAGTASGSGSGITQSQSNNLITYVDTADDVLQDQVNDLSLILDGHDTRLASLEGAASLTNIPISAPTWVGTSIALDAFKPYAEYWTTGTVFIACATNGIAGALRSSTLALWCGPTNTPLIFSSAFVPTNFFGHTLTNTLRSNMVNYVYVNIRGVTMNAAAHTNVTTQLEEP